MDNTLAGPRIAIPSILKPLITSQTLFLLNKTDIAPSALGESFALAGSQTFWKASLNTGKGTAGFLFGLGKTLQERYVLGFRLTILNVPSDLTPRQISSA